MIVDAGTRRAARSEPVAILVKLPKTEIFVGPVDIKFVVEYAPSEIRALMLGSTVSHGISRLPNAFFSAVKNASALA